MSIGLYIQATARLIISISTAPYCRSAHRATLLFFLRSQPCFDPLSNYNNSSLLNAACVAFVRVIQSIIIIIMVQSPVTDRAADLTSLTTVIKIREQQKFLKKCLCLILADCFWQSVSQAAGPAYENARLPNLDLSLGVRQFIIAADRSPLRVDVVATNCTTSDIHDGHREQSLAFMARPPYMVVHFPPHEIWSCIFQSSIFNVPGCIICDGHWADIFLFVVLHVSTGSSKAECLPACVIR